MWTRVVAGLRCCSPNIALSARAFPRALGALANCRKASDGPTISIRSRPLPLSQSEEEAILSLRAEGFTHRAIAARLGRHHKTIGNYLLTSTSRQPAAFSHKPDRPISQRERDEIQSTEAESLTRREVAARLNRHESTIGNHPQAITECEPAIITPRKGRPLSEGERDEIVRLEADGLSGSAIARQLGRGAATVRHHLRSNTRHASGQSRHSKGIKVSEQERREMLALRQAGLSQQAIADRLRLNLSTVRMHLRLVEHPIRRDLVNKRYSILELQRLLFLRACGFTLAEIGQDLGRRLDSVRNVWGKTACRRCPPIPTAFAKETIISIRELVKSGAALKELLDQLPQSSRLALDCWLHETKAILARRSIAKPWADKEIEVMKRLRAADVSFNDIADQLGRSTWSVKNKNHLEGKKKKDGKWSA